MKLNQVAFQLYTCRDLLKTPTEIAATFKRLRAVGYTAVELCGMGPISEEEVNRILQGEGIVCCSTHESSDLILANPEQIVERLEKLHCSIVAYPYPGNIDFSNAQSVAGLISGLQRAGEALHRAGKTLCYHNHQIEFRKLDGKVVLDQIYDGTSKNALSAELDTYWVHFGGGDVVEWCEKLRGRLPVIHLKDYEITAENKSQFCEIGSGNLNFRKIITAAETAGSKWFIVEQDVCPGDPVESLAQSFRYIQENLVR